MSELCYIPNDDGYTEDGYIAAVPRVHPEVRFKYRPTRTMERVVSQDEIRSKSSADSERLVAKLVADRIISWDIKLRAGEVAKITPEFILSLKGMLYRRLAMIVYYGTDGGDTDPKKSSESELDRTRRLAASAEMGVTTAELDRGN